jgi:hypothetical protein
MDDYKSLKGFGIKLKDISTATSDKGQFDELTMLHQSLISKDKTWPIELWDLVQTSNISLFCSQNTGSAAISEELD